MYDDFDTQDEHAQRVFRTLLTTGPRPVGNIERDFYGNPVRVRLPQETEENFRPSHWIVWTDSGHCFWRTDRDEGQRTGRRVLCVKCLSAVRADGRDAECTM